MGLVFGARGLSRQARPKRSCGVGAKDHSPVHRGLRAGNAREALACVTIQIVHEACAAPFVLVAPSRQTPAGPGGIRIGPLGGRRNGMMEWWNHGMMGRCWGARLPAGGDSRPRERGTPNGLHLGHADRPIRYVGARHAIGPGEDRRASLQSRNILSS